MRWAFVSTLGFPPERTGGAQMSVLAICRALKSAGDTVAIACMQEMQEVVAQSCRHTLIRYLRPNAPLHHQHDGIDQWRFRRLEDTGWDAWAVALRRWLAWFAPDVVVVDAGLTRDVAAILAADYRTVVSLRDVEFQAQTQHSTPPPFPTNATYIANSTFTATRFREAFNLPAMVIQPCVARPCFTREKPITQEVPSQGEKILFINPDPRKGWALTLELIRRLPQFVFRIQESWPLCPEAHTAVQAELETLPNAEFHTTVADIRDAFQDARCLIVPSDWEEAWGRVVTEAQIFGLPVIARAIGGLPESVGNGGLLLAPETDFGGWTNAISSVMTDDALRNKLIHQGKTHVDTHLVSPAIQAAQLRELVRCPA